MLKTAKARYEELASRRSYFLDSARRCAALTIPTLMPPQGWTGSAAMLNQPYQGLGARGVVNLSARLLLTLLPPGVPFFKLGIPKKTLLAAGELEEPEDAVRGLSMAEKSISSEIETKGWRQPTNMTLQLLVTTGNALEYIGDDGRLRVFRLDQYVVLRDASGNVIEVILEQMVSPDTLSEEMRSLAGTNASGDSTHRNVPIYVWCKRLPTGGYAWTQWVGEKMVPKSMGQSHLLPLNPLRWSSVPGEDYGRGKVEEHLPDLETLDDLTKSLVEGAKMAAWHVLGVDPNASNARLAAQLKDIDNGDIVSMKEGDIFMAQFGNVPGLQIAQAEVGRLSTELGRAFLMTSGIQRNAERVTATELRIMAEELEGTLGGVFSMLSEEMQRARVERLIHVMQQAGSLPAWSKDQVEPTITTGLAALGREQEALKVIQGYQSMQAIPPQAGVMDYIKHEDALKILYNGFGLPGLIRSEAEVAQVRQQRMMEQMAASAGMAQQ